MQPPWIGPPEGVLGGVVPQQLLIARTENVMLVASHITVFPNGIAFELSGLIRELPPERRGLHRGLIWDEGDPETMLRIGVLFADGRRVSNINRRFPTSDEEPTDPVMIEQGGGGGDRSFRQGWWVWPAPPPGALVLVAEWPALSVPESRATIDAPLIEDARTRILEVWPSSGPSSGGWESQRFDLFGVPPPPEEDPR